MLHILSDVICSFKVAVLRSLQLFAESVRAFDILAMTEVHYEFELKCPKYKTKANRQNALI